MKLALVIRRCHSTVTCKVLLNQPQCKLGQLCANRCLRSTQHVTRNTQPIIIELCLIYQQSCIAPDTGIPPITACKDYRASIDIQGTSINLLSNLYLRNTFSNKQNILKNFCKYDTRSVARRCQMERERGNPVATQASVIHAEFQR